MNIQSKMAPRSKEQFEEIREGKRALILQKALELFADQGYDRTSISDIAKAAGISQGLLYNYFESKETLLHALIIGAFESMLSGAVKIDAGRTITKKEVRQFIEKTMDLIVSRPHYWKLYFSVFMQPEVMNRILGDAWAMSEPYMASLLTYFKERGDRNPEVTMRYFIAIMDGVQLHVVLDPDRFPVEAIKKMLIKQFA